MKSKGEVCSVPHGLVVWSTGVGTRPVVRDFMEQIGQVCFIIFLHIHRLRNPEFTIQSIGLVMPLASSFSPSMWNCGLV